MKKLNEIYPNRENGVVLVTDYVYDLKPESKEEVGAPKQLTLDL